MLNLSDSNMNGVTPGSEEQQRTSAQIIVIDADVVVFCDVVGELVTGESE